MIASSALERGGRGGVRMSPIVRSVSDDDDMIIGLATRKQSPAKSSM